MADRDKPLHTSHLLNERCCSWEFYATGFEVPTRAFPGSARVTVERPLAAFPLQLESGRIEVPVPFEKRAVSACPETNWQA